MLQGRLLQYLITGLLKKKSGAKNPLSPAQLHLPLTIFKRKWILLDLSQVDEKEEDKLPEFILNLYGASQVTQWVKNLPANVGYMVSIPGSGISPGEGNGNPLQYSCLRNPRDRGAWRATVHGVTKSK